MLIELYADEELRCLNVERVAFSGVLGSWFCFAGYQGRAVCATDAGRFHQRFLRL